MMMIIQYGTFNNKMMFSIQIINMNFVFPSSQIRSFQTKEQIKLFIQQSLDLENLTAYCSYKFRTVKELYFYCLCTDCNARLVFKKAGNIFQIARASTHHQHNKIGAQRQHIIQTINTYPKCFNVATIKKMIMTRFNISASTFYRYLRKAHSFGENIKEVLHSLKQNMGIFGVSIENEEIDSQLPKILLLTSEKMIAKFYENEKNVKFDLTYNLIREQPTREKQYAVGFFVTVNKNSNINPVCIVVMQDETKQSFIRVFRQFFYLMKSTPRLIITDEQITIRSALQDLKQRGIFTGFHLLDIFHLLRNAKNALFHKPSINDLISLSRCTNLIEYRHHRKNCLQNLHNRDVDLFSKFEEKLKSCCIALIPPIFIGLSSSTNSSEKLNDIVKKKIPFSLNYVTVIGKITNILDNMNSNIFTFEKLRVEKFTVLKEVGELRLLLSKRVFGRLMIEISLASTCLMNIGQNQNFYYIQEQQFQDDESLEISFDTTQGRWLCQCKLYEKIGLPCAHVLKVMIMLKQKLIIGINKWWLNQRETQQKIKTRVLTFPRKTRRNK